MIRELTILFFVASVALAITNFEEDHGGSDIFSQHLHYRNQKKAMRFDEIRNDKAQLFFETFRFELSNEEAKKLYRKLDDLAMDTVRYVESKAFVSDKEATEFIDNGLKLLHKEFTFETNWDTFIKRAKGI
jgi:hypothetical protein